MTDTSMPTGGQDRGSDADNATVGPELPSVPTISYGTEDFDEAASTLPSVTSGVGEHGLMVVFHAGHRPERQQALAHLTAQATPTVHQFQLPALLGERRIHTQNALRKAFDHAAEEDAVLYFENVDALFSHVHTEGPDVDGEAAPTTVEYFLDRVDAYRGLVILCVEDPAYERSIRRYTPPDLVVTFDEA